MSHVIVPLDAERLSDFALPDEPFESVGRLIPGLRGGEWETREKPFDAPREKRYPAESIDPASYIGSPDRAAFLCYADGVCAGRVRVRRNWNRTAFVEDLAVRAAYRRAGIGAALLDRAAQWARDAGLAGLMLETQDVNLPACRFYKKYGFRLGGADTRLYGATESRGETALFWYLPFEEVPDETKNSGVGAADSREGKPMRKKATIFSVFMACALLCGLILIFAAPSAGEAAGSRAIRANGGSMDTADYERAIEETTESFRTGGLALALTGGAGLIAGAWLALRGEK